MGVLIVCQWHTRRVPGVGLNGRVQLLLDGLDLHEHPFFQVAIAHKVGRVHTYVLDVLPAESVAFPASFDSYLLGMGVVAANTGEEDTPTQEAALIGLSGVFIGALNFRAE